MNVNPRGSSLNNNMTEISRTITNLKFSQRSVIKDIESEEIYKDKLLERLNESKKDLDAVNDSLSEKRSLLDVYEKILKDSDNAYSKIVQSTESLFRMISMGDKKLKSSTPSKSSQHKNLNKYSDC